MVVVLGNGILGNELAKQTGWDTLSREEDGFDITDPSTFSILLDIIDGVGCKVKYDTVINCIANTDTYSKDRQKHWDVNYKGVADLVDFCNQWKIKLVHISTDYVYANSSGAPTEEDVPVHQETYYAYTKLLADGYVELRSNNYLLVRGTHKERPFKHEQAWVNQVGNFDYVDVIAEGIIKLVEAEATGVYNVGTPLKSIYALAQQTNPEVLPGLCKPPIPVNTVMNIDKLKRFS